ncbi:MAG: acyltransferase family protein [Candidatus Binataceae bacterium]
MIRLRRITTSLAYRPEIDGIRFVAILSVIIYHLAGDVLRHSPAGFNDSLRSNWLFWLSQNLNFGVQLFFVLSGYVLALPFAEHFLLGQPARSLKRYFLRRLTRLEPPYVLALICLFALKLVAGRGTFTGLLPHLFASIFYLHNQIYAEPSAIDFVAWSLEIEVQFYILAPFLAAAFFFSGGKFYRRRALIVAIFLSAIVAHRLAPIPRINLSLIGELPYFLAGFLLADFSVLEEKNDAVATSLAWDAACVLAIAIVAVSILAGGLTTWFVCPLGVFGAYYAAFHSIFIKRFLSLPFISIVGGMCYSIYLLHDYVIAICGSYSQSVGASFPFSARLGLQLLIMTPVLLLVCGAFFVLVERPCMQPAWPARLRSWFVHLLRKAGCEVATRSSDFGVTAPVASQPHRDHK